MPEQDPIAPPVSSPTAEIPDPASAPAPPKTSASPEEQAPMLDVHPAHHAANSWKEFFVHIATIVIGLLIAVGLEQTVEYFHHQHQIHQIEADLEAEDIENQSIARNDREAIDQALDQVNAAIAELEAPANRAPSIQPPPEIHLMPPSSSAWSATRDSGLLVLAPRSLVDNYWKVYFVQEAAVLQIKTVFANLDRIQALASLHRPAPSHSADRDTLLVDYANYRESLQVLKIDLDYLNRATEMALHDRTIDVKTLNSRK